MPEKVFDYKEKKGLLFSTINRPLINVEAYSKLKERWFEIPEILADTGADVSILPRYIGEILLEDFTSGKREEIRGIVPHSKLIIFIHTLCFRINSKEFHLPTGIADCDDVPPIIGRINGLDIFKCIFDNGKKTIIKWEDEIQ